MPYGLGKTSILTLARTLSQYSQSYQRWESAFDWPLGPRAFREYCAAAAADELSTISEKLNCVHGDSFEPKGVEHLLAALLNSPPRSHVNIYLVAYAQEKSARVLHSPLNIRDDEMRCNIQPVASGNSLDQDRHSVVLAVNPKQAADTRFG